jgi:hypothetical protein
VVQRAFAGMPERRVSQVMSQTDGFYQVGINPKIGSE